MQNKIFFLRNNFRFILSLSCLTALFIFNFFTSNSFGRDVSFNWSPNTDTPPIDGYRLYYKIGPPGISLNDFGAPTNIGGAGTKSYTLQGLSDTEQYSFVLTAYRGSEESSPTYAITLDGTSSQTSDLKAYIAFNVDSHTVNFVAGTSTGNINQYDWTFGDGATGSGYSATHIYSSEGKFQATLKVTDTNSATAQASVSVEISDNESQSENNPPTAVISSSSSVGSAPLTVNFDGSQSKDTDGSINSYRWDFGDGAIANGSVANHTYSSPGMYTAKLTVTDNGGMTDSVSTPALVDDTPNGAENTPPTAVISASSNKGSVPFSASFNAGRSYDPDGHIVSYMWNFGDGEGATGSNVTHNFNETGTFKVTLTVEDDKGTRSTPALYAVKVLEEGEQEINIIPIIVSFLLGSSTDDELIEEQQ